MDRPIQANDHVDISGSGVNQRYIIRNIATDGIYISTEQNPDDMSLLVWSGDDWKIYGSDNVHQISFSAAPDLSNLPLDQLKKIVLFMSLSTAKKVIKFCGDIGRHDLCKDVDFWNRWEQLHPPHPEWIYGDDRFLVFFKKGDPPDTVGFYELEYDEKNNEYKIAHPNVIRNVTEDELDTIVSKDPIRMLDEEMVYGGAIVDIHGRENKGVTLRDFIEEVNSHFIAFYGEKLVKESGDRFSGLNKEGVISWV